MPMKSRGCPVSHLSPWQPARLPSFSCILSFFHALWPDDVAEGSSRRSRTGGDDRGEHLQPDAALVPGTYSGLNRQGGRTGGPLRASTSHKLASRTVFTKKGALAVGQIPFEYCNGAEGLYRPTGYPAAFHAFTPPPSALAFLYPWAMYFSARPAELASLGQAQ